MIESLKYEVWEPVYGYAKYSSPWCLQYKGEGNWEVKYRKNVWRGVAKWFNQASGDVDALATWARKIQTTDSARLGKQFRILLSGSYEKRLQHLRQSLIVLGTFEHYETSGGVGTSFVVKCELRLYAELGNNGGIDVWGRSRQKFGGEATVVPFATDCMSIEEIEVAVKEGGFNYCCEDSEALQDLLSSTAVGIPISDAKQTYIAKPKGRPRGGSIHICTSDEFDTYWQELDYPLSSIRSSMESVINDDLEVDWRKLLQNQKDLLPKIWEEWNLCSDCFTDMTSLLREFPFVTCKVENTNHSVCCFTSYEYYVKESHFAWFESCLEFVANRLENFVEDQDAKS
jgi:hypothetical protein